MRSALPIAVSFSLLVAACAAESRAQVSSPIPVTAQWSHVTRVSITVPTTQHLANALTLRSNPLNKKLLADLRDLHTNDTRLQLWYSVPNQVMAELKEPTGTETFWDFKYMDPVVTDFFASTSGLHHINIGTMPRWMFKVPVVDIPPDPGASFYAYTDGTSGDLLKDPTGKQFAEFQARLYRWYTQGGFIDEVGKYHKSGHHFKIDYWGILNEPDFENKLNVEQYTRVWDAVAGAIRKIDPNVQFFGPEVSGAEVEWARYFLNPRNHTADAPPVRYFSLHNYISANNDPSTWQARYFTDPAGSGGAFSARAFVDQVQQVMKLRDEMSPQTKIVIDELGTFDSIKPSDGGGPDDEPYGAYNPLYWVATGGNWAANFITAEKLGLPLISMTQMVGAPTQSPSCSMINPNTAQPNAHYWVLWLINRNFGPGDKLVDTTSPSADVFAQAYITTRGRKLLVINTSDHAVSVVLDGAFAGGALKAQVVDEASGENPPRIDRLTGRTVQLAPFAVAVVSHGAQ
jgi:hypothetical protein